MTALNLPAGGAFADGFVSRLKTALTGDAAARFVFVGNIEVERQWAAGAAGLPRMSFEASDAVVNQMDELALTLAGGDDYVVLKTAPDPGFLAYLTDLGFDLPTVVAVGAHDPMRTVTEDALADEATLATLSGLAGPGTYLLPHGISSLEEELARRTGVPLAGASAAVCRSVNSKVYSRRVAAELGLRQPMGWACESLEEFADAVAGARDLLAAGRRVALKDAFGVCGKGIVVVEEARRLDRLHRLVATTAGQLALVVEEWVPKQADFSYQFTIGTDGTARFDFVKRAITEGGVYKGHHMPAGLNHAQLDQVHRAAALLGERLASDGYRGVVGVDAMLDPAGGVYPVTEINARCTMSTYQATLTERLIVPGGVALARHYDLKLAAPLPFERLLQRLDGLLLRHRGGSGLVINTYATVNAAAAAAGVGFGGRLYGVVAAGSDGELAKIDAQVEEALHE